MLTPVLEKLLILQDRDRHRRDLESQLQSVPREIAGVEAKIASEKAAINSARTELMECETQKKILETEIASVEQQLARYRTQQLEVRKNDEYQALGHEIETKQGQIGELEEKEIGVLYSIDEARKKFAAAEAVLREHIAGHESRIRQLRELETRLRSELTEAHASLAEARVPLDEISLRLYDRVASRNFPACVPVRSSTCGGCHLKVSSEVESAVRSRDTKLITCDQCGRIVWFE